MEGQSRFVLPVSGIQVALRPPTGADELLLAEASADDPGLALAVAARLARADRQVDWAALTPYDVDVLIVRLRKALVGRRVVAELACAAAGCGQRMDLSFEIDAYLAHHRPRGAPLRGRGWSAEPNPGAPGWFRLQARGFAQVTEFRLPTMSDQIEVFGRPGAEDILARACIRPFDIPGRLRVRVESVMEIMAPQLAGELEGRCPECGTTATARFLARQYCLQELRERARFVYEDIDLLAQRYHWSERAILRMPNARRAAYAELARGAT
jgi:hypothetical protein